VPNILNSLDLFVFSSLHEGLPIALNEAMLAKIPIVVSDIEPLLEATQNGKFAAVFPKRDSDKLADEIIKLLRNNELRRTFADQSFDFAKETFSIEAHLRNLKELYESI
jgi:glycosyltransferase involved in cell wall biosynthesis